MQPEVADTTMYITCIYKCMYTVYSIMQTWIYNVGCPERWHHSGRLTTHYSFSSGLYIDVLDRDKSEWWEGVGRQTVWAGLTEEQHTHTHRDQREMAGLISLVSPTGS